MEKIEIVRLRKMDDYLYVEASVHVNKEKELPFIFKVVKNECGDFTVDGRDLLRGMGVGSEMLVDFANFVIEKNKLRMMFAWNS